MKYEFFNANTSVFNIDEKGEKFYLILSGIVGVFIRKNKDDQTLYKVKELRSGQGFGEMALISNKLRSASIICLSNVHLASLEKIKFNIVLKSLEQQRLQDNLIYLESIPYFSNWSEQQLKQIYYNSFRQEFHKNEKVFEENQEIDSVFIILDGEFMQSKHFRILERDQETNKFNDLKKNFIVSDSQNNMKNIQVTIMQKNELFGEEDIIGQQDKRTFTVTCLSIKGEVLMVKQKDFQRIIMADFRSRQLIEKRLSMKNVVRNARISTIAAQFDKLQYQKIINQSPTMFHQNKNNNVFENKQFFDDEYSYYRQQVDLVQLNQEELLNSQEIQENQQQKNCQNEKDQNISPRCNMKKKVQKDILVKGFQEQLKFSLIKKFNSLQLERLHNTIPKNLIESIDQNDEEIQRQLNLKQRHNQDIRLTDQQKKQYQRILIKRQAQEQMQNLQEQKTFTRLVQCTSHENLSSSQNLSNQFLSKGSSTSKSNKAQSPRYRFSTPENILRQPIQQEVKSEPYFHFANYSYTNSNSARNIQNSSIQSKPTTAIFSQSRPFLSNTQTQVSSPQLKSSQQIMSPTPSNKSDHLFCRKENIKLKKCDNLLTSSQISQESEINTSSHEVQQIRQKRKSNTQIQLSKNIQQIQQSYYNNFTNPYQKVVLQIKKKKQLEDLIKTMNSKTQYQINNN